MEEEIVVHPRVTQRHPDIADLDVVCAWRNAFSVRTRDYGPPDHVAAAGPSLSGQMIEIVAVQLEDGSYLAYHAMKLSKKMAHELGIE